jgi:hypothetical protein
MKLAHVVFLRRSTNLNNVSLALASVDAPIGVSGYGYVIWRR